MWNDSKPSDIDMKIMCVNALKYLLLISYVPRIDSIASASFGSNHSDVHVKCCNIVRTLYEFSYISLECVFS